MKTINCEKQEILLMLQEGTNSLEEVLRDIDEDAARRRPGPESWSVLQCIQHVTLVERGLLARLMDAKPNDQSHQDRAREAKFHELALNRVRRIEAPPQVVPAGESESLAEAIEDFREARSTTVRFVEEFRGSLRSWLALHPLITRPVNAYEMLLLMAMHPKRHAMQIAQIRQWLRGERTADAGQASNSME